MGIEKFWKKVISPKAIEESVTKISDKTHAGWREVLSLEGGELADYTDRILRAIEVNFPQLIRTNFNTISFLSLEVLLTNDFVENRLGSQFPDFVLDQDKKRKSLKLTLGKASMECSLDREETILIAPIAIVSMLFGKICAGVDTNLVRNSEDLIAEKRKVYQNNRMDLDNPRVIFQDNIITIFQLAALFLPSVKNSKELIAKVKRLITEKPPEFVEVEGKMQRINPGRRLTYLELFGLAPFSTIASFRDQRVLAVNDRTIFPESGELLSGEFMYYITRKKLEDNTLSDSYKRHGGCPVLHEDFKHMELINRMGRVFLQIIEFYEQNQEKFPTISTN